MRKSHINISSLKSKKDIQEVFTKGLSFKTQGLKLIVKKSDISYFRILISISRGYGNAVCRNRLKRRVRSIFKELLLSSSSISDIALVVYKAEDEMSFKILYNKIQSLFIRSKII